jgi:hypothetical protein
MLENPEAVPEVYKWSDFKSFSETKEAFILQSEVKTFNLSKELISDPANLIRIRAILEGVVAANPAIEYSYGRRILPPKTLCVGCEIPPEAYVATGAYKENEINNSNVILRNPGIDTLLLVFSPIAAGIAFVLQVLFFGNMAANILQFLVIALFAGGAAGLAIYLTCVYASKTLYGKILRDDPALLEEITFVVCEEGFIAVESEVYDYSDIIKWHEVAYFIETDKVFIIFNNNKAVCWIPKRMFPKEMHKEVGDFIADKLQQK